MARFVTLLVVSLCVLSRADYRLESGTIALWNFNDGYGTTVHDEGPYGLDGQLRGSVEWIRQRWGKGVVVNGSGSGIVVPDNPRLNVGRFLIEATVYPTRFSSGFNNVVAKEPPGSGPAGYILRFERNGILAGWIRQEGGAWESVVSPRAFAPNQWYAIAFVKDSASMKLFVNGTLIAERATLSNPAQREAYPMGIGCDAVGQGDRSFYGYIDAVRISNVARLTTEIVVAVAPTQNALLTIATVRSVSTKPSFLLNGRLTNVIPTSPFIGRPVDSRQNAVVLPLRR